MVEENKALVRRNFEEVWNQENLAVIDELHDSHYLGHIASSAEAIKGSEQFKHFVAIHRLAFPDMHFTIEDQLAEGDKVATRWSARGTHQGEFLGIAPGGQTLTITGISIHRIVNGKIQESWDNWDALSLLQGMTEDILEAVSMRL